MSALFIRTLMSSYCGHADASSKEGVCRSCVCLVVKHSCCSRTLPRATYWQAADHGGQVVLNWLCTLEGHIHCSKLLITYVAHSLGIKLK